LDGENRRHDLRAVFNALRWLVRSGASWRMMPHEFPPWPAVYQQMRRWLDAGCFEAMVNDLRVLLREHAGRSAQPSAMILTSNQSFGAWGEVFGDRVIATAILDRLLHHAVTLNIRGNSYRLKEKLKAGLVRAEETNDS
jgi:transposase